MLDLTPLNQTNEALQRFGNTILQIGADMKRQEDERNRTLGLLEFHTWATDQTQNVLNDLHKRPYSELQTDDGNVGEKRLTDLNEAFASRYKGVKDKRLALEMQRVSDGLVLDAKGKYNTTFEAKKRDHFLGVYQDFEKQQFDKIIATLDPQKRAQEIAVYESGLLDLVRGVVMDEKTASTERIKMRSKVDSVSADMLIDSLVPGSTLTPQIIEERLKDPGLFPYLTVADRFGKIHKLYTQAKTWKEDVRKEVEEDALQNIYDVLGIAGQIKDSGMREKAIVGLEGLIDQYTVKRTISSEKRKMLQAEIQNLRAGKTVISDPEAKLELTELVATGKIGIKQISNYLGVSPQDKDDLIKYKHSLDSQMEAIGRAAANQQRSFDIAERNRQTERAISEGKHIITQKGPFDALNDEQAYWSNLFVQDVLKKVKSGGDPWDVVNNIHVYTGKMEVPFINVPGSKWLAGRPKNVQEVQTLKTWIPYYVGQGKTKEANILADQLKIAERILQSKELNAKKPKSNEERRTR